MREFEEALVSECRHGMIPGEHDLFGPMIGVWDIVWTDDFGPQGTRRVQGEWIFSRVLDGTAVQDVFICPSRATRALDRQADAEYGATLRIYNPATEAWDIFYGCPGTANRLEARREGECVVLTEVTHGRIKYVFSEITPCTFHWQRIETADGETWRVVGDVAATRRK